MRSFVAITLPENTVDALSRVQSRLPVGRLVSRANLHLTLAFLDDQPVEALELLHEELERLWCPEFLVRLTGLGCFGGDRPRLIFADVGGSDELERLQTQVTGTARRAGIALPRRRYHPHVTLARPRPGAADAGRIEGFIAAEQDQLIAEFPVREIALYRSQLRPAGAVYDVMATYDLSQV